MSRQEFLYQVGRELCRQGVPHRDMWGDEVKEGYRFQYELEQQETVKSERI